MASAEKLFNKHGRIVEKMTQDELRTWVEISGIARRDQAQMMGITVGALMRWLDKKEDLEEMPLVFLCTVISLHAVHEEIFPERDATTWFEIPLTENTSTCPKDFLPDTLMPLLDYLSGTKTADQILDGYRPNWREEDHSDWEVFVASDGAKSIRPRS